MKSGEKDLRNLPEVAEDLYFVGGEDFEKVSSSNMKHKSLTTGCGSLQKVVQLTHPDDRPITSENETRENMDSKFIQEDVNQSGAQCTSELDLTAEIHFTGIITQLTCKICLPAVVGIIFLPCGYHCCHASTIHGRLHACRKTVNGTYDHLESFLCCVKAGSTFNLSLTVC